jgi:uncharacterized protein YndB with AHSA1/START domain
VTPTDTTTIRRELVLGVPVEKAFTTFVERFGEIKNKEHNLLASPIARTTFEPRVGGNIYDVGEDGSECRWSRVLAYEPPHRVLFSWDISPQWQIETDPARTSEVEVTFTAESDDQTRVVLEHRHIERHGEGWEGLRFGVDAGWQEYLENYLRLFA